MIYYKCTKDSQEIEDFLFYIFYDIIKVNQKLNIMKKRKEREYDVHHRKPKCLGGSDEPSNLSRVLLTKHRAFHQLFGHGGDVRLIAKQLNDIWLDPKYQFVVVEIINPKDKNQLKLFKDNQ